MPIEFIGKPEHADLIRSCTQELREEASDDVELTALLEELLAWSPQQILELIRKALNTYPEELLDKQGLHFEIFQAGANTVLPAEGGPTIIWEIDFQKPIDQLEIYLRPKGDMEAHWIHADVWEKIR